MTRKNNANAHYTRVSPSPQTGLTRPQVQERIAAGAVNLPPKNLSPTVGKIIARNALTLFNIINLALAAINFLLEPNLRNAFKSNLFIFTAVTNTLLGIIKEIRSKRTLDRLSVLAKGMVTVVRDGEEIPVSQESIVMDDVMHVRTGDQICADSLVIRSNGLELDESQLTGEADRINKSDGDKALSGSYVTGGEAYLQVEAVGAMSFASALSSEAMREKTPPTPMMRSINLIIRTLTFVIIPLGTLFFCMKYFSFGMGLREAVSNATVAVIGMIPEGLILLTGVALTAGALSLARENVLVQTLPSIETLARVDLICLDKTGTITDGTMTLAGIELIGTMPRQEVEDALRELSCAVNDANATAQAIRQAFAGPGQLTATAAVPFSSERKWSAASFEGAGTYVMGAPGFVFPRGVSPGLSEVIERSSKDGLRVLCLASSERAVSGGILPDGLTCEALIMLSDSVREDAAQTFRFFAGEGVALKVISGDNPFTVASIAARAGLEGCQDAIDMSGVPEDADLSGICEQYTVFGRTSPYQKKNLVAAMKRNGHTVCMTGDGVNDILAMKEADCSVAMVSGSAAARNACAFVLMTSDFRSMVGVLREGRKLINNIENVSSLYLVKTIYATLLTLAYLFIKAPYPFGSPLQMMPINWFAVGVPSFFLALRSNTARPEGRFIANILEHALPAALSVVFGVLSLQALRGSRMLAAAYELLGVDYAVILNRDVFTMAAFITGCVVFTMLYRLCRPFTPFVVLMYCLSAGSFLFAVVIMHEFFRMSPPTSHIMFLYLPVVTASILLNIGLNAAGKRVKALMHSRRG